MSLLSMLGAEVKALQKLTGPRDLFARTSSFGLGSSLVSQLNALDLERIAADPDELDLAPSSGPRRLAALLDVEERMGATDPYRQLGQLAHLILRKASTPPPEATDDSI